MKLNIDQLFKSKLSEVKVNYKAEYWQEMEKMLPKKSGGASLGNSIQGGLLSSTFFKSALISTVVITTGIVGYIYFGDSADNSQPSTNSQTVVTQKEKAVDPCDELLTPKAEGMEDISYEFENAHLPFVADYSAYLNTNLCAENEITDDFNVYDYNLYLEEEVIIPERQYLSRKTKKKEIVEDVAPVKAMEASETPRNIKPMEKPIKRVFKKRKGLLHYLGLKK